MFGIGGFELFIILIFGFLIFGPDKLPDIAKTVGRGIARFREAQQEMNDTLGGEKIFDPNNPDEPFKDPVEVLDKLATRQEEKRSGKASAAGGAAGAGASASGSNSAAGASASRPGPAGGAAAGGASRQESFTERKARYERERAARKAAEEAARAEAEPAGATDAVAGTGDKPDALASRVRQELAGAPDSGAAQPADVAPSSTASAPAEDSASDAQAARMRQKPSAKSTTSAPPADAALAGRPTDEPAEAAKAAAGALAEAAPASAEGGE